MKFFLFFRLLQKALPGSVELNLERIYEVDIQLCARRYRVVAREMRK